MFGSHLSIAGGLHLAAHEADDLSFDTVQIFTKNQRRWAVKPLDPAAARDWRDAIDELGWTGRTVAHDSYLINLASPDDELWRKSIDLMREEIVRCAELGVPHLVSHPGAHTGSGADVGLRRIADAYRILFRDTAGAPVAMCFENTAGGGSTLGRTFEELAALARYVHDAAGPHADGRVRFCLDSCHALAAGYDLATHASGDGTGRKRTIAEGRAAADAVLAEADRVLDLRRVAVLHLNDSIGTRGSCRDRHAHIGAGHVAKGAFAALVNHPTLQGVPKILETPKGEDDRGKPHDARNLAALRRLLDERPPPRKRSASGRPPTRRTKPS